MKKHTLLLLNIFFVSITFYAQPATDYEREIAAKFEFRSHTYQGTTLPYRLFVPENYNPNESYPLVLTLHGSGERGNDNIRQVTENRLATVWADTVNQKNFPCFVVSPQCPNGLSWNYSYQYNDISISPIAPTLAAADNIIDELIDNFNIDTTRLYVTGISMGGYGTWDLIMRYPDRFAAAVPMNGGGDVNHVGNILSLPVWNFHGRIDEAVPINESRILFDDFTAFGRDVTYTHCSPNNCDSLLSDELSDLINSGADCLFTEYENEPHVMWRRAYNHPELLPWVFKQYHLNNSLQFSSDFNGQTISGQVEVIWQTSIENSSVDVYYTGDYGATWHVIAKNVTTNSFTWNTESVNDAALAKLKLVLRDENNIAIDYEDAEFFSVNNSGNGNPIIRITNKGNVLFETVESEYEIEFIAADPDNANLNVNFYFSDDNGNNYQLIESVQTSSSFEVQTHTLNLEQFKNSLNARVKVEISDGENFNYDESITFRKQTEREPGTQYLSNISGNFDVPFYLNIVDESQIQPGDFMITFDDTSSDESIYYTITNRPEGTILIDNTELISNTESEIFNGMSFTTSAERTRPDQDQSGWNENSSQNNSFSFLQFHSGDAEVYPAPFDYRIEFYDGIVDTSVADTIFSNNQQLIFPERKVNFKVKNTSKNEYPEFVSYTSGTLLKTLSVYLKENLFTRKLYTWRFNIVSQTGQFGAGGDTLFLKTYKGLTVFDTVFVSGTPTSVENETIPQDFILYQNYPNPFNPTTKINFTIPTLESPLHRRGFRPARQSGQGGGGLNAPTSRGDFAKVRLVIYDILGREIAALVNKQLTPGNYEVEFDATGLSSGVYFYRLNVNGYSDVKKMMVLK